MRIYQVQLETRQGGVYAFEVFTDDHDAVEISKEFLRTMGVVEWKEVHCGCFDCIGGTLDEVSKGVCNFRRQEPGKATGSDFEVGHE